jgi:heptosyltransferase-1
MRILIVKLTSMGDILFNLSVVADLKARFPNASIDWASDAAFADLPRAIADIDTVYAFPFRSNRPRPTLAGLRAIFREIKRLRQTQYDLVIDTQGMVKSGLISLLAKGKEKWGYQTVDLAEKTFAWVYRKKMVVARSGHAIDRYREEIAQITGQAPKGAPSFRYRDAALSDVVNLTATSSNDSVQSDKPVLLLIPFASQEKKDIPSATIQQIIERASLLGYQVMIPSGSPREVAIAKELVDQFDGVVLLPRLTIRDLITLMGQVSCVIGADTGLVHIAASRGLPVAAVFRATDAQALGPDQWAAKAISLQADAPDLLVSIETLLKDGSSARRNILSLARVVVGAAMPKPVRR